METSVARPSRALLWLLVSVACGALLSACSGGTMEESPRSGSPVTSAPVSPSGPESDTAHDPAPAPGTPTNPSTGAATDTTISLSWQPNTDPIKGYLVYYGPTEQAVATLAVQMSLASNTFDIQTPGITFNAGRDLGLQHGDSVCFRLRAYNDAGMSDWSPAACGSI